MRRTDSRLDDSPAIDPHDVVAVWTYRDRRPTLLSRTREWPTGREHLDMELPQQVSVEEAREQHPEHLLVRQTIALGDGRWVLVYHPELEPVPSYVQDALVRHGKGR